MAVMTQKEVNSKLWEMIKWIYMKCVVNLQEETNRRVNKRTTRTDWDSNE